MLATIGQVLPLVVAGAMSSVPVVGVLTLLLGRRGPGGAVLFALGYLLGVFVVTAVATAVFGSVIVPAVRSRSAPVLGVLEMALGVAAVVSAVVLLRRPRGTGGSGTAGLTALLGSVRPGVALAVGAVVALRPKALLLAGGIGIVLGQADVPVVPGVVLLAVSAVVTTSTVTVPVVFALVREAQARAGLEAVRAWLARNARTVTIVVLLLVGTVLVGDGLGRL